MEMDKLVALCKRRGFLFQSSEIYGGLQRLLGLRPAGRRAEAERPRGLVARHGHRATTSSTPRPAPRRPTRWSASTARSSCTRRSGSVSGHYDLFHDYMVDCRESKRRYRYDQVQRPLGRGQGPADLRRHARPSGDEGLARHAAQGAEVLQPPREERRRAALGRPAGLAHRRSRTSPSVLGPDAKALGTLTEPREFNLMFKTHRRRAGRRGRRGVPAARDGPGHLRQLQERAATARGCGCRSASPRSARASATRSRRGTSPSARASSSRWRSSSSAIPSTSREWYQYWRDRRYQWYVDLGLAGERLRLREHDAGGAEPLLVRHGRHRIRLPVPAAGRVRRAGRRRPPRRLRPPQPHGRQARPPGRRAGRRDWTPTASRGTAAAART